VLAAVALGVAVAGLAALASPSGPALEVKASREGFSPASLTIRKGEATQVVLTTGDVEHCFAVDELRIEKRIVPGRATRFDLAVDRAGTYVFYCCLGHGEVEKGELTVVD
jgi:heme/copper-type cytochrome/quinol oxidase subunit 2